MGSLKQWNERERKNEMEIVVDLVDERLLAQPKRPEPNFT